MKRILIYITSILLIGITLVSCKKSFLDIVPKGKIIATKFEDFDLLMNNENFYQQLYGGGLQATMLMGDEVSAEEGSFASAKIESQRLFRWEDVIYQPAGIAQDLSINLGALYVLNKIINEIDNAEGNAAQKAGLKAEAKAARAFLYFQFVNFYTKPYNAQSAVSDPGFPIVTEANSVANDFSRGTVQDNYNFMIRDLTEAMELLPLKARIPTRMSKPAAEAILGKIYLFMGKYQDALNQFNNAFLHIQGSALKLYDYNVEFAPGGSFLPIGTYGPNGPGNNPNDFTESILSRVYYGGEDNGNGFGNDGLVLSAAATALYNSTDWRLKLYSATFQNGDPNPYGRLRKYGQQYIRYGVELADLYLLRAECKARLNDLTGSRSDIEALRAKRIPPANALLPEQIAGNQNSLIRYIIDERIREYAFGGHRWFDMRRLSVDPLFSHDSYKHILYLSEGAPGATTVFSLKPQRLVLRFPQYILTANPGMQDNP